ncbi:hypothetical protein AAMO2058_001459600 [Amorphochlora amoebiformis]
METKKSRERIGDWEVIGCPCPPSRTYFSMASNSEKLWMFGGFGEKKKTYGDLQSFDPVSASWRVIPAKNPPQKRHLHASCIHNGLLYVHAGSVTDNSSRSNNGLSESKELFSLPLNKIKKETRNLKWTQWVCRGDIPPPRYGHSMVGVGDHIYISGGSQKGKYQVDSYRFDPSTGYWQRLGNLPFPLAYHSSFSYKDNVFIFGGFNGSANVGKMLMLNKGTGNWNEIKTQGAYVSPRCGMCIEVLEDHAFLFGGYSGNKYDTTLYKIDLKTLTWKMLETGTNLPEERAYLQSGIAGRYMYIFGGYNGLRTVSDFRRIAIADPPLNFSETLIDRTPGQAAAAVLKYFGASREEVLKKEDLVALISIIQGEMRNNVQAEAPALKPSRSSGGERFSLNEIKMVDQAVAMGLKREAVVASMKELKDSKGVVKDINQLIDKAVALMEECKPKSNGASTNGFPTTKYDEVPPEPPEELCCPISGDLFEDPVITDDGHTYERGMILSWFKRGKRESPLTNERLTSTVLRTNHVVRNLAEAWRKKHPDHDS